MIGRLTGRVVEESADGTVVLDVSGVGYELTVPLGTIGRAAADPAAPVHDLGSLGRPGSAPSPPITLFVHTHVREDALLLYGFASREDRAAFRVLIGISNIGPKIATNILSAVSASELALAVARGETNRLTAIPGIGKKTAERIVLELKDKLIAPPATKAASPGAPAPPPPPTGKAELLHGALTRMGFKPAEAERALTSLGARVEAEPLGDLVRDALAILSR